VKGSIFGRPCETYPTSKWIFRRCGETTIIIVKPPGSMLVGGLLWVTHNNCNTYPYLARCQNILELLIY